jgi:hypothetical protein
MIRHVTMSALAICTSATLARAQSRPAPITRPIEYHNPDWSPDGRRIVFESTLSGTYSIYSISDDGSDVRRLTPDSANNEQARWSPDGKRIVFSSDRAGHLDLYLMNADGSNLGRLTVTNGGGFYGASFSPDGRWVVFQGRPDNAEVRDRVYVVASDGTGFRQVSDSSYGAEGPMWSGDGRAITFRQVPYPRRFWAEMEPADVDAANKAARLVTIRLDGSGLVPAIGAAASATRVKRFVDSATVDGARPSADGRRLAYAKAVGGWPGLYVYDFGTRSERLLTGGPGAGPVGYLRTTTLTAGTDTLDTFESPRGNGPITRGNGAYVVRSVRPVGGRRWEVIDTWHDSAGQVTARQSSRTARGSLAIEVESVRASGDSASMLVTPDRVTAWVVPQGRPPRLFDGAATTERFEGTVVAMAIARSHPAVGTVFVAPQHSLYGGNPIETRLDSIRVARRDTLYRGRVPLPALVLARAGGGETWVDESTGAELLSRGNAGPERWWWHIRRGVTPPAVR